MALDFPSNPTVGQQYAGYIFDGVAWDSTSAQPISLSTTAPGYNYIINGGFDVWQRGTSFNGFSAGTSVFGPDRFYAYRTSLSTGMTISRQTSGLTGIQYCARVQRDSGNTATTNTNFLYDIETANSLPLAGKTVTLSFYARAGANFSSASSIMFTEFVTGTGTDQALRGGYTGYTAVSTNHTLTTSWQRFNVVTTVPSNATQVGLVFKNTPVGTAGAADYYEITGIQLEEGGAATNFKRNAPSIQAELAACQRYYYRVTAGGTYTAFAQGTMANTTVAYAYFSLPTSMRITPNNFDWSGTYSQYTISGSTLNSFSISSSYNSKDFVRIAAQLTGSYTSGANIELRAENSTTAYFGFDAEL